MHAADAYGRLHFTVFVAQAALGSVHDIVPWLPATSPSSATVSFNAQATAREYAEDAPHLLSCLYVVCPLALQLMGQTALHLAIDLASASAVQTQLKAGCSVNSPGVRSSFVSLASKLHTCRSS